MSGLNKCKKLKEFKIGGTNLIIRGRGDYQRRFLGI